MAKLIFQGSALVNSGGTTPGGGLVESVDGVGPDENRNVPLGAYTNDNPPPATVFDAGEVAALPAGSTPTVNFHAGDDGVQVVDFGIPNGQPGADGKSAYQVWLDAGNTGTEADFLASLQGAEGDPGPANVLTIGAVDTLAPGSPATAEITGTSPNQVLNLGIPQGEPGSDGSGGGSTIPALGEPGSPGFFILKDNTADPLLPGDTVSGSAIWYAGVSNGTSPVASYSIAPSGTWEARGYVGSLTPSVSRASLFVRVDQVATTQQNIDSLKSGGMTRNFQYANAEGTAIDCELLFRNAWHKFTARANDLTWWGKMIFEGAIAGDYGEITAYTE